MTEINISEVFKELRKYRGLTQQELADKIGITAKHMNQLERGVCDPNWKMLNRVMKALDANISIEAEVTIVKQKKYKPL